MGAEMCIGARFWLACSDFDWDVWVYAVASEANPADPLSRPGTAANDDYAAARGWRLIALDPLQPKGFRMQMDTRPLHPSLIHIRRCRRRGQRRPR